MGFNKKILTSIHKKTKGEVEIMDHNRKVEAIASGSVVIDEIIGIGGYPKGRVTEIYGDYSSGKTTLALHAIKSCQDEGLGAIFMDYEETFDSLYAQSLGVSVKEEDLLVVRPHTLEEGWATLKDYFADEDFRKECGLIVFDSVAAMTPKAMLEGDPEGSANIGIQARRLTEFLPWITKAIRKDDIAVILLNQERLNIQKAMNKYAGGPDTLSTGGKAVQFYNSVKLHLKVRTSEKDKRENPLTGALEDMKVLNVVRVSCLKNKIRPPFLQGDIYIRYGQGIDNFVALISIAMAKGKIEKQGGGYYNYISCLTGDPVRVRGKEALEAFFAENPDEYDALAKWFRTAAGETISTMSEEEIKASETKDSAEEEFVVE